MKWMDRHRRLSVTWPFCGIMAMVLHMNTNLTGSTLSRLSTKANTIQDHMLEVQLGLG